MRQTRDDRRAVWCLVTAAMFGIWLGSLAAAVWWGGVVILVADWVDDVLDMLDGDDHDAD